MNTPLRVKATRATQKMIEKGMFARVQIDVVDEKGFVWARLTEAVLRWGKDKYFLGPPSRKGQPDPVTGKDKYWDIWRLFPELPRDERDQWNDFIVKQVVEQLDGDPTRPAQPRGDGQQAGGPPAMSPPSVPQPQASVPTQAPSVPMPPTVPAPSVSQPGAGDGPSAFPTPPTP